MSPPRPPGGSHDRRSVLAGAATLAAAGTAGCVTRARSIISRDTDSPVSLSIKTLPADRDPYAIHVARALATNLRIAGVGTEVTPMSGEELRRQVLINADFDLFVSRYPASPVADPGELYPLLHSTFGNEPGWQNPFGFADLHVDDALDRQRRSAGEERVETVQDLQEQLVRSQPFTVVCFPDTLQASRPDRLRSPPPTLTSPRAYLLAELGDRDRFRVAVTDARITENRNPLAVEFRNQGVFLGLLYDQLAVRVVDGVQPWLAADWEWTDGKRPRVRIRLREDLAWHDGSPLTAADVAFTLRFLRDTSMGESESPIPAPRFRQQSSLVSSVTAVDDRTVDIEFVPSSVEAATAALAVPVLPESEWAERTGEATLAGISVDDAVTEAIVWNNPEPVGSGPFRFERATPDDRLELRRFEDHFLRHEEVDAPVYRGGPTYERLVLRVVSSPMAAVQLVADDGADATGSVLSPATVPRIGRETDLRLTVDRSRSFYLVGCNVRRSPLSNPRFRAVVSRLLDREHVVSDVFEGYAMPAVTPLADSRWSADGLRGEDGPMEPFLGENGEADPGLAREAFREAGYRYNDDGELVGGSP